MFKLNKATHMLILMTFTIVFIVVYMYYMIRDVKKIYADVKKQGQEVVALQSQVQELKNAVANVSNSLVPHPIMHEAVFMSPMAFPQQQAAPVPEVDVQEEDAESVATEDIKKLVEDGDAPEEEVVADVPVPAVAPTVTEDEVYTEESLKKLKFEEIKDICKKLNITVKGSKESLIAKIIEHVA